MSNTSTDTLFKLSDSWVTRIQDGALAIVGSGGKGISTDDLTRIIQVLDVLSDPRPLTETTHKVSICIEDDAQALVDTFVDAHILVPESTAPETNTSLLESPVAALLAELDGVLIDGEMFSEKNSTQKMALAILAAATLLAQHRKAFNVHRAACATSFRTRAEEIPRPLRINIGAGSSRTTGWLTVDISPDADIVFDVTRPWPLPDNCVNMLYVSHVLEHFELDTAVQVLTEAHRVLAETGVIRIVVPNAQAWLRAYVENDDAFFQSVHETWTNWPQDASRLDLVMSYLGGGAGAGRPFAHRVAYDFEKLEHILAEIGYCSIEQSKFGGLDGDDDACVDFTISLARQSPDPDRYALFVTARK